MIIGVDFDGTLVEHEYPEIGEDVPHAFESLKEFQRLGAKLILWTMRSDSDREGLTLTHAVEHCRKRGVEFWGVNQNPEQIKWTASPKAYCHLYVDDAAYGCPLKENPRYGGRDYVDWYAVAPKIIERLLTWEKR